MRRYETVFITDADVSEDDRNQVFERTSELIANHNGLIVKFDEWGAKKLAYEIKKKNRGYYVCIDYGGDGALVAELERSFRIDDKVLKFMTIIISKEVDYELLKEEQEKISEKAVQEQEAADTRDENIRETVDDSEKVAEETVNNESVKEE